MTAEAVVFDLFGTLVPEFSTSDFFGSVRDMARVLGADPDRFEDAWRQTAEARQTGVFATVEDNVRHICEALSVDPSDDAVATALDSPAPALSDVVPSAQRRARNAHASSRCVVTRSDW